MSKNDGRFLRRRVACQKTMAVFCTAGLHVKKRWPFSAPQGCMSKNNGRFLRRRVARQKFLNRLMLAVQLRAPNESSACNWTLRKADSSSHNLCFLLTGNFHNPNV